MVECSFLLLLLLLLLEQILVLLEPVSEKSLMLLEDVLHLACSSAHFFRGFLHPASRVLDLLCSYKLNIFHFISPYS